MSHFFEKACIEQQKELNVGIKSVIGFTAINVVAGDNDDGSSDMLEEHYVAVQVRSDYVDATDGEIYTQTTDKINFDAEGLDNLIELLQEAKTALAAKNKEARTVF